MRESESEGKRKVESGEMKECGVCADRAMHLSVQHYSDNLSPFLCFAI